MEVSGEKENPKVSIVMATYNRDHLISEAINSIKSQTYKNWECIIIDDDSTDKTKVVVQSFIDLDGRFRYFKRSSNYKKGLPGARNMGIDLVTGDFIVFFDDDDTIHPENLQTNIKILIAGKSSFCRYDKKPFTANLRPENSNRKFSITPIASSDIGKMITGELPFASCTVMWDKNCFQNLRFNEDLQYAEEWELYSRILSEGHEGVSINKVLYFNRKHPKSNTGEYWGKNPIRMASKIKATKLVINHLAEKNLLTDTLNLYFIQLGFFLKNYSIINHTLEKSKASSFRKIWFKMKYKLHPFTRTLRLMRKKIFGSK